MLNNSGVYEIANKVNGKRYVGSASKFRGRFAVHQHMLRRGNHHSLALQRAWLKYGEDAFDFRVLLICSRDTLALYEQVAFDALRPEYNACPFAHTTAGLKWSEEARARVAATRKNDHFLGRKHSPETIALMSAAAKGNTRTRGKKRNPDAVAKTAAAHRGMKRSDETRERISLAMRVAWTKRAST